LYLQAEDYSAAYSEFETCLKRHGEAKSLFLNDLPSYRYIPPVYYYLGRAQEEFGSEAASATFQKFLRIKKDADPGINEVEDSKKRLAGLKGE
jgi:hypothetical protein